MSFISLVPRIELYLDSFLILVSYVFIFCVSDSSLGLLATHPYPLHWLLKQISFLAWNFVNI